MAVLASLVVSAPLLGVPMFATGAASAFGPAEPPATAPSEGPTTAPSDGDAAAANGWDTEAPAEPPPLPEPTTPGAVGPQPEPQPPVTAVGPAPEQPAGAVPTVEPMEPLPLPPATPEGVVKQPAPRPDGHTGIGFISAAGAVGGAALFIGIGKMVAVSRACNDDTGISDTIVGCVSDTGYLLGLTVLGWVANATTFGLAPPAGAARGRYDASRYAYDGYPDHRGKVIAGIGGGVLGVGVITKVALWVSLFSGFRCPDDENYSGCVRRKFAGYFGGTQLASTAIAFGAGTLAYGVAYNRDRVNNEKRYFRPSQVRVMPIFSRRLAGLSLGGRF